MLSLSALPVLGAMAAATRASCSHCGCRFWPDSDASNQGNQARFPVAVAIAGLAILVPPLGLGLLWIRSTPGQETLTVGLTLCTRVIMAVLAPGLSLLIQAIIWRALVRRTLQISRRSLLLLLPPP